MSQYNKLSDIQYARIHTLTVDLVSPPYLYVDVNIPGVYTGTSESIVIKCYYLQ